MQRGARIGKNRQRLLVPATLLVLAALVVVWWQPWRMPGRPPGPTPNPSIVASLPTSTVARRPDQIVEPSGAPTGVVPPPVAATPATTLPAAAPALRDAGSLIYLGRVDGPPGIVAANADGSERRLLAPGVYLALAWSPDGARFAALGGNGYEQIAIFDGSGRPRARHAVPTGSDCALRWSPDSRFVVCVPTYPFQGRTRTTVLIADEADVREVLVPPVVRTSFLGWPRPGLLGLLALPEEWPYAAAEVWQIELDSGDVRRLIQGDFWPLGWSADGRTLLALGGRQPRGSIVQAGEPVFTELIAVDTGTGERRMLERADLVGRMQGDTAPGMRFWFNLAALSPNGDHLALWVVREPLAGTPGSPGPGGDAFLAVLGLYEDGTPGAVGAARPADGISSSSGWSPDGQRLAVSGYAPPGRERVLAIFDRVAAVPLLYPLGNAGDPAVTWSPDGGWFAYVGPRGLAIAATRATNVAILDPEGRGPAWRPAVR